METMKQSEQLHTEAFMIDVCSGGFTKNNMPCTPYKIIEDGNVFHGVKTTGDVFWIDTTILLDPRAWQCVAKVRGWNDLDVDLGEYDPSERHSPIGWLQKQHEFINLLSDGMSVNEALGKI